MSRRCSSADSATEWMTGQDCIQKMTTYKFGNDQKVDITAHFVEDIDEPYFWAKFQDSGILDGYGTTKIEALVDLLRNERDHDQLRDQLKKKEKDG
jgi:hypothetical protein